MPRRGEVWLVDLGLAQKTRPVLILSTAYSDRDRALITVISHTTKIRGSKFELPVSAPFLKPGHMLCKALPQFRRSLPCGDWAYSQLSLRGGFLALALGSLDFLAGFRRAALGDEDICHHLRLSRSADFSVGI